MNSFLKTEYRRSDSSIWPSIQFWGMFSFLFTRFSFLQPLLLCITCPYPPAIHFGFKLCKMFLSLTAMSCHLTVQSCSRPQSPRRTQTLQEKWDFFDVTALRVAKASFETTPFNQDSSCPSLLFAANSQGHEAALNPGYFLFKYTTFIQTRQMFFSYW